MRKIQMDCLPGLSGRLAHLQSSNILTTKMEGLLAELNMRYFNSANRYLNTYLIVSFLAGFAMMEFVTMLRRSSKALFGSSN